MVEILCELERRIKASIVKVKFQVKASLFSLLFEDIHARTWVGISSVNLEIGIVIVVRISVLHFRCELKVKVNRSSQSQQ